MDSFDIILRIVGGIALVGSAILTLSKIWELATKPKGNLLITGSIHQIVKNPVAAESLNQSLSKAAESILTRVTTTDMAEHSREYISSSVKRELEHLKTVGEYSEANHLVSLAIANEGRIEIKDIHIFFPGQKAYLLVRKGHDDILEHTVKRIEVDSLRPGESIRAHAWIYSRIADRSIRAETSVSHSTGKTRIYFERIISDPTKIKRQEIISKALSFAGLIPLTVLLMVSVYMVIEGYNGSRKKSDTLTVNSESLQPKATPSPYSPINTNKNGTRD